MWERGAGPVMECGNCAGPVSDWPREWHITSIGCKLLEADRIGKGNGSMSDPNSPETRWEKQYACAFGPGGSHSERWYDGEPCLLCRAIRNRVAA